MVDHSTGTNSLKTSSPFQKTACSLSPKAFILKRYIMHPNVNSHYTEDPKTN